MISAKALCHSVDTRLFQCYNLIENYGMAEEKNMRKILVDTDIGSDIDDCFALAYLLSQKDIEIMGITTTGGKSHLRAQLAHRVCTCYGADIEVHPGKAYPMSGNCRQPKLTNAQTIVAEESDKKFAEGEATAVDFLKETIEANPGEITLVCIGPLTNVGELFGKYPHIPTLLKEMVIMGGRYTDAPDFKVEKWGETEWNIVCDAEAAYTVFENNVKLCTVAGVEETCKFFIKPQGIKEAFLKNPRFKAVSDSVNTVAEYVWFHDIIAIYGWLYPEKVELKRGDITVTFDNKVQSSKTVFEPNPKGLYSLISGYNPKDFFENYIETVGLDIKQ